MHILAHRPKITAAAPIDHQRLVTSAEQMSNRLVPPIEPACVGSQKPLHPGHQICFRRFDHQVEMITHQTIGVHLPVGLPARFGQRLQEPLPVVSVAEYGPATIAAVDQVINRPRILDSQFPCHDAYATIRRPSCQY